ncbi:unnamed protein product, partial [Laminaria digitata]
FPRAAVKCNPDRAVVRALAMNPGCGFDVASSAEMNQVLHCGVDPSRIIYANPCKDLAALDHALSAGIVTMTFDSKDELHKIRRQLDARTKARESGAGVQKVQMVLRLRVPDDHSNCPLGEKYGAIEQDCSGLITLAIKLRLPLVGVSFHCGSGCEDAQAYPSALIMARAVFDLAAQQGLHLTLLDIGGGFPGWDGSESVYHQPSNPPSRAAAVAVAVGNCSPSNGAAMREDGGADGSGVGGGDSGGGGGDGDGSDIAAVVAPPLSLAEVAKVTVPVLDRLFPPSSGVKVIAEPGRYLVEASHILFARIYAKRGLTLRESDGTSSTVHAGGIGGGGQRRITAYFIGEGVHGCFKDRLLCDVNYEPCPVSPPKQPPQEEESPSPSPFLSRLDTEAVELSEQQLPTAVEEEEEDAMVMGPSGLPTDMVARKRLPTWLAPGDWLYFSRMGAYTASIATVSSSAALHASYCYVAGTPAVEVGGVEGAGG